MANRICCYCGLAYTDKEGPHHYETCVRQLDAEIENLCGRTAALRRQRRKARALANEERSQQRE